MKIFLSSLCMACLLLSASEITYKGEPGPVTFGVPFKQGAVKDASKLHLNGKPMQVKVNGRWPDGSVKWALFDTELPRNFKVLHPTDDCGQFLSRWRLESEAEAVKTGYTSDSSSST